MLFFGPFGLLMRIAILFISVSVIVMSCRDCVVGGCHVINVTLFVVIISRDIVVLNKLIILNRRSFCVSNKHLPA